MADRRAVPAEETRFPDYALTYVSWSGTSPGGGFTYTSLAAVELDMPGRRVRRLRQTSTAPAPMLPHDDSAIRLLLQKTPWVPLSAEQVGRLSRLVSAWLATHPPQRYNKGGALGTEDGHMEYLVVSWSGNSITARINPRAPFIVNDPLRPPAEWDAMLEALWKP